jgi:hypothetical protein
MAKKEGKRVLKRRNQKKGKYAERVGIEIRKLVPLHLGFELRAKPTANITGEILNLAFGSLGSSISPG